MKRIKECQVDAIEFAQLCAVALQGHALVADVPRNGCFLRYFASDCEVERLLKKGCAAVSNSYKYALFTSEGDAVSYFCSIPDEWLLLSCKGLVFEYLILKEAKLPWHIAVGEFIGEAEGSCARQWVLEKECLSCLGIAPARHRGGVGAVQENALFVDDIGAYMEWSGAVIGDGERMFDL